MPDNIPIIHGYSIGDLLDKTIMADRKVYIYDNPTAGAKPIAYVEAGRPVGVLWSWLNINPAMGRDRIWLIFYPPNSFSQYYYAPYNDGDFDWSYVQQQGVLTVIQEQQQEAEKEKEENKSIFEKIADWFGSGISGNIVQPVVKAGLTIGVVYVAAVFILPKVLDTFDKRKKGGAKT